MVTVGEMYTESCVQPEQGYLHFPERKYPMEK